MNVSNSRGGKPVAVSAFIFSALVLTSCQSSGTSQTAALETTAQPEQEAPTGESVVADNARGVESSGETQLASTPASQQVANASSELAIPAQCSIQLAGGPPAKPPRGRDFGRAVAKNTGKAVQRGIIQQIGGAVAGGLGAAVAGGLAQGTIRQEEDIKGVWQITDGNLSCACEISVDSLWKLKGKGADSGFSKNRGCSNPVLQQVAAWTLGYSFSGYDSKFELKAKDKQTVLATLNRDGIHYFSGALRDGTPIVMWRERQTYNQLAAFNKSVK